MEAAAELLALKAPTFHLGHKAQTALEVRADGVEAPAELGVTAILVGTAGVVADVQLVAALGHCWDAQVHLGKVEGRRKKKTKATFRPRTSGNFPLSL